MNLSETIQNGTTIIWGVIIAYIVIIIAAGSFYSRYMNSADEYFRAGNNIPWWAAGISMYMTNFTAYTFVGIASLVYMRGFTGLLLETGPALAFLLAAVVFATRWHRLDLTSPPEYMELRFNRTTRQVYSFFGILSGLIGNGIRLLSMCKLLESFTGFPAEILIVLGGGAVIIYTMLGGLWGVIITDVLQFIILLLAAVLLLTIAIYSALTTIGWHGFWAQLPEGYAVFPNTSIIAEYSGIPVDPGSQWMWMMVFWFSYLIDYNGNWGVIQRMCCTPTESDAKKSAFLAAILSVPHAFLLLGVCFIARVLWGAEFLDPNDVQQAEMVFGKVATTLLPAGLVGIVAAAMLSATMSTLNVSWAVQSTSVVNDLWKTFFRPNASEKESVIVGRISVAVIGGIATSVALVISLTETDILGFAQSLIALVVTPVLLPMLLGVLLRKVHPYGALTALVATFSFGVLNKVFLHWQFEMEVIASALVCTATMLLSGVFVREEDNANKNKEFFSRISTPRSVLESINSNIPAPLLVVSLFLIIIGLLIAVLVVLPQPLFHRMLTTFAALTLITLGILLRHVSTKHAMLQSGNGGNVK